MTRTRLHVHLAFALCISWLCGACGDDTSDGAQHDASVDAQSTDLPDSGEAHDAQITLDARVPEADGGDPIVSFGDSSVMNVMDSAIDDAGDDDAGLEPQPLSVASLATGYDHACAITTQGELYCWGANGSGQLGIGNTREQAAPARVGEDSDWTAIATGRFHTCGIRAGDLYCWGNSVYGQAASSSSLLRKPKRITSPAQTWKAVTAGDWHTCALTNAGKLYCFGYSLLGRVGNGTGSGYAGDGMSIPDDFGTAITQPTAIDASATYVAVDAGAAHTCGVREDGDLYCWGSGDHGELGSESAKNCLLNSANVGCELSPIKVPGSTVWKAVSAGGTHSCALANDDSLHCFGDNANGQLGQGDTAAVSGSVAVSGSYSSVAAGGGHTCVVRSSGRLACFGNNESHQLGVSDMSVLSPTNVGAATDWSSVVASPRCSCAIATTDHAAYCWGQCAFAGSEEPNRLVL